MPHRPALIYVYDGSFAGLMCCVFESYEQKEIPLDIQPPEGGPGGQQTLFAFNKRITTDQEKSDRVYQGIARNISPAAQELVRLGFFTCAEHKEMLILNFLRLGFKEGRKVMNMLADDRVNDLQKRVRQLTNESHKYTGFVRFSVYGQVLAAVIEPKNYVLPLMISHFCDRFRNENFLIYDKTHRVALIYQNYRAELVELDDFILPQPDGTEEEYRRLWKQFYDTIAIEGRYNPRCRMTHMPKRYWGEMTEFFPEEKLGQAKKDERAVLKQGFLQVSE